MKNHLVWSIVIFFCFCGLSGSLLMGQEEKPVESEAVQEEVEVQDDAKPEVEIREEQRKRSSRRPTSFWPEGTAFDESIPTPKQFFGFDVGVRHLDHSQVAGYMQKLAEASDRISIQQYATTHGGRPLLLLTVTAPANRDRLLKIKRSSRLLAKKDGDSVDTESLPAVINMGYGVHGDEPSATNCSPLVAYYLAAAKGEEVDKILENCIVLIDPSLNPDGFNRFANWANRYRGRTLNPDPQHAEHNQMWPPGRVNYYWFDLNRDWLPVVHPESRGRMRWYHQWKPNVVLDFHEMGTNSTYFFQPGIPQRKNPLTPASNVELTRKFATYHAKALDEEGSLYFTQERFDDFYMGKGSTYPDLHGAVGILFEQASSRGHIQRNQDGLLKFHDTIANQFATSLSSLRATVELRTELHEHKKKFYQDAFAMADKDKQKTLVFSCPHNRTRLREFSQLLLRHDIQAYRFKKPYEFGEQVFSPLDSVVVPTSQAEYRFLKSLLMRRKNFRENVFYDVSSWTISLAYGMQQKSLSKELDPELLVPLKMKQEFTSQMEFGDSDAAYLIDWRDDGATRLLADLLKQDVNVRVAKKKFRFGNQEFPVGTLQVPMGIQPGKRGQVKRILRKAVDQGIMVTAVNSGLVDGGIDLGSPNFVRIEKPELAMLIGRPVSAYGAGEIWHQLDTRVGLPISMLKLERFSRTSLAEYNTLILAAGRYDGLDDNTWGKIKDWVSSGGTLIAVGGSAGSIGEKVTGLENLFERPKDEESKEFVQKPFDSAAKDSALKLISGAIFNTRVDTTHPLAFGLTRKQLPVFRNHTNFLVPTRNAYSSPLIYDKKQPLMAGYCSSENIERFKGAASTVVYPVGNGQVVLISDNPNFRGFWRGTSRVFMNAVYFGRLVSP